jgi:hypothetical protein
VPNRFQEVASFAAKYEQMAAVGIELQRFLDLQCEPIHAAAHVGAP